MAGEWPTLSLREANITLIDCDHRTPPASEAGYPYVAIPQLRGGRVDLSDVRRIKREHLVEWTRKAKPSANDVILSRRCNPGETAVVPPDLEFALGQNLVLLRANGTKVYPPFLRWLVRGPEWWDQIGKFLNVGAVFDSLRCADVPNFELRIPPLPEQRAIAHILGTLDDKIELNRRMNETLEAMARALFKSWFADFDPVRAKAEGRDPGLSQPLADLFPDSFEESELGDIPKGWTRAGIGEWATALSGGTPSKSDVALWNGNVPWISPKVMTTIHADEADVYVSQRAIGNGTRLAPAGSTLVMVRGMGLHQGVRVSQARCGVTFNQDVKALVPRRIEASLLLFALLDAQQELLGRVESSGHGTGKLPSDVLLAQAITMPNSTAQKQLVTILDTLNSRIALARDESRTLAALRDTLLPKLISGGVRVKDAEKIVEIV
jgi:type I restriction enzyme S subunit